MNSLRQPTYIRQRYLVALLDQIRDNGIQMTYLQKIVFLNEQKTGKSYYDFIPYHYGPYSFQLAEDLDILCKNGQVVKDYNGYHAAMHLPFDAIISIPQERGRELVRKAYREYPYYTMHSKILLELFSVRESELLVKENDKYSTTEKMLFTIGYEGRTLEAFINTLIQNNVRAVCDVRKNALSRKFGFSKNKLEHILPSIGIEYINIPELGIESEKRQDLGSELSYKTLFHEYEMSLPYREPYLSMVYRLYQSKRRIALMCFERDPQTCHRHVVRDYLLQNYEIRGRDL